MKFGSSPLLENVSLLDKNSFAIGGYAQYYCITCSCTAITEAIGWCKSRQLPFFVLGNGSNVLISDNGWQGLVLHLFLHNDERELRWRNNFVEVPGGYPLAVLVKAAVSRGFGGMEELAGIPGTVGGAVVMNAGAFSQSLGDTLESVTCYNLITERFVTFRAHELGFGYRKCILQNGKYIVVSAVFCLSDSSNQEKLEATRRTILECRKSKQPLNFPNCGSVFKRPKGHFAGKLIEESGLKGLRCGKAEVSKKHANFIINTGGAKSEEVRCLIRKVQQKVYHRFSILLEPEVIFIGDFKEPLFRPQKEF